MNGKIKIVLVSPLPPPEAGIGNWTAAVLHEAETRNDIEIVNVDTRLQWRSITDFSLYKRLLGGSLQAIRDVFRTYRAIRASNPYLIHLCTSGSLATPKDILILILAKILGVPRMIHIHMGRLPMIIAGSTWEWKMIRIAMKQADTVLLLDQKSEDAVKKALPNVSVKRIPNPINMKMVEEVLSKGEKKIAGEELFHIVYVGHVLPTKGVCELVKACLLIEEFQIELDLVGPIENDFRRELEGLAAQRMERKWLRVHGNLERQEAMGFTRDSDLFVLPSYTEGFPYAVLEAMALGKPIVATKVGAIPEMLGENTDEPCGLLVNPQSVNELRDAILYLFKHPEISKMYGDRAQKKTIGVYSMERVMEQYVSLWRSLAIKKRN
jgi:glycosyltransferase involved in cell wall biosynthesis